MPNIETKFETGQKISLLDYLPGNTVFWFKDLALVKAKMAKLHLQLEETLAKGNITSVEQEDQILRPLTVADLKTLLFGVRKYGNVISLNGKKRTRLFHPQRIVFLFSSAQTRNPVFNRNFQLLIAGLKDKIAAGYTAYIFAENARQLERLRSIFDDSNAQIDFVPVPIALRAGFIDHEKKILAYTDHQIFQRYHKYKVKQAYSKSKAITLKALRELVPGDYVTHIDHGVGVYSGLQKIEVNGAMQEAVRIIYRDNDVLYVNINSLHKISKYTGKEGTTPKVNKLGSDAWEKLKNKTKKQVKDIAADLIKLYAKRKATQGFAHILMAICKRSWKPLSFMKIRPTRAKPPLM